MMTEEEWSDFEDMVTLGDQARYEPSWRSALTGCAYRELKERREDEEFLRGPYHLTSSVDGTVFFLKVGKDYRIEVEGPTLHAAVSAARGK